MTVLRRILERPARALRSMLRWQKSALKNFGQPAPIFPPNRTGGLRVHLGAGEVNLQGWINVDARPFAHIHAHTSSLALNEFTDGAIHRIYICHVLEHVSFAEATELLAAFHRKLAVGGVLMISVPDFDALVRIYTDAGNDLDAVKYALMGGQGYEFNFHKSVYNHDALKALLEANGYGQVSRWTTAEEFGADIGDWSSASLSLNLKATRI